MLSGIPIVAKCMYYTCLAIFDYNPNLASCMKVEVGVNLLITIVFIKSLEQRTYTQLLRARPRTYTQLLRARSRAVYMKYISPYGRTYNVRAFTCFKYTTTVVNCNIYFLRIYIFSVFAFGWQNIFISATAGLCYLEI